MAHIAVALGPEKVCCLTSVRSQKGAVVNTGKLRVYRRPLAFSGSTPLQAIGLVAAIGEILLRDRPRVLQLATVEEGYLGLWLNRLLRLPFVIYAHGNEILSAMNGDWEKPRLALRNANRVFANSRFTKKLLIQAGADADKIDIIHPGCDVERFRPLDTTIEFRRHLLGQRYRDQVILTVGNLVSRKGHDMVIRALSKLRDRLPNVTYLIVGDGPYRDQIEKVSKDVGVRDHVVFAGQIPSEDLPHVYAISDVFAMPSRDQSEACDVEGFGLVFLEANACGKPVIGGRCGGMPDAIVDGVTGFLVNPEDPEDIAIALRRLLTDSNLANRLGRQGYSRVVRDFTWPQVGTRVQGILDSIGKSNVI